MKESIIMHFNHWWMYLIVLYYLTWTITYQIMLHKSIQKKDGALYSIWKYIKFLWTGIKEYIPSQNIGDIFLIIFVSIWLLICVAWLIFCWTFSVALGFIPILNNAISSCRIYEYDPKHDGFAFEHVDYKKTPIIRMWIAVFYGILFVFNKFASIKIRKEIT